MKEKDSSIFSVREHMKEQTDEVCRLLDDLIRQMSDEETLQKATMSSLASAVKIIAEKYGALTDENEETQKGGVIILPAIDEAPEDGAERTEDEE